MFWWITASDLRPTLRRAGCLALLAITLSSFSATCFVFFVMCSASIEGLCVAESSAPRSPKTGRVDISLMTSLCSRPLGSALRCFGFDRNRARLHHLRQIEFDDSIFQCRCRLLGLHLDRQLDHPHHLIGAGLRINGLALFLFLLALPSSADHHAARFHVNREFLFAESRHLSLNAHSVL